LALEVARRRPDVELVSADSMQVYRGMDIGTAKPSAAEQAEVPHHLIDIVDPWDDFNVSSFQAAATEALAEVRARGAIPVLVGGTGLYLRAITDGLALPGQYPEVEAELCALPAQELYGRLETLDPVAAGRMEPTNHRRILRALVVTMGSGRPFSSFGPGMESYPSVPFRLVYVELPRPVIYQRIEARYRRQMSDGFLTEVSALAAAPRGISKTARQALGYRELLAHLAGAITLEDAVTAAITNTRRFARRQQRWFRRDPRLIRHATSENPMELIDHVLGDFDACV
jgi:tRNA dimethylallyltransferase